MSKWKITIPEITFVVESVSDAETMEPETAEPETPEWEFGDDNPCWAYASERDWLDRLPIGDTPVVPIHGGSDFATNLKATVDAAGKRVIVQLEEGVYELDRFQRYGGGSDPKYSFGFWHKNLAGLVGRGPDKTFVQMKANSMSAELLTAIQQMKYTDAGNWQVLQTSVLRIDGSADSPVCVGGLTFRTADQQNITSLDASFDKAGVKTPQPAPHRGLFIYPNSTAHLSHVRFRAFGRAVTSAPPFESPSLNTQRSRVTLHRVEIDGRRDPVFDPARPRRCGIYLMNDEYDCDIQYSHFHHSNVSRYAVNDENYNTQGRYRLYRSKIEQITTTRNDGLGGATDACCMGWESTAATIEVVESILCMDNPHTSGSYRPQHLQLAKTGGKDRTGGHMLVSGTVFRSSGLPDLDGWAMLRLGRPTQWYTEGIDNRIEVRHPRTEARLQPHSYDGEWPPTAEALKAAGVSKDTHYLVRLSG